MKKKIPAAIITYKRGSHGGVVFGLSGLGPNWEKGNVRTTSDRRSSRGRGLNLAFPFLACTVFLPCGCRTVTQQQRGVGNQMGQVGRVIPTDQEELFVFILQT